VVKNGRDNPCHFSLFSFEDTKKDFLVGVSTAMLIVFAGGSGGSGFYTQTLQSMEKLRRLLLRKLMRFPYFLFV